MVKFATEIFELFICFSDHPLEIFYKNTERDKDMIAAIFLVQHLQIFLSSELHT